LEVEEKGKKTLKEVVVAKREVEELKVTNVELDKEV